jgi:plasmid stabilization system protein ParE
VKHPRLLLSDLAIADILEQADWYSVQSGEALAERWERAVTSSVLRIVNRPAMGTLCTFRSVELRDVRRTTIPGFPKHLLFYKFQEEEILILRVLHGACDLERLL